MEKLTNRSLAVNRSPMTFGERIYLPAIAKGMSITLSHIFKKKATVSYPEQKRPFSPVFRGLHILNRDEEGRERVVQSGCAPHATGEQDAR